MSKLRNPPLFYGIEGPQPGLTGVYVTEITLRDLFAAFALAGMYANPTAPLPSGAAKMAYREADVMLADRLAYPGWTAK